MSEADSGAVTVVIPTWNRLELLIECLRGLSESSAIPRIVVVDNGSSDGTLSWLATHEPRVEIIANDTNLGFARAVNQGILKSETPWVALLNNDAVPAHDWLERMIEIGNREPRIGSVATRMMFRSRRTVVSSAGVRLDAAGVASDLYVGQESWPTEPIEVFGASGGACLYRRAMLDDVGLLEESFFAYLEDVDLAWRARMRGWKSVLAPAAVVHHAVSASLGDGSSKKRYLLARNKWWTIMRNYPGECLRAGLPGVIAYDALSLASSLARRDLVTLRGRRDALASWPQVKPQRDVIQRRRTAPWADLQAAMSPPRSAFTLRAEAQTFARLSAQTAHR